MKTPFPPTLLFKKNLSSWGLPDLYLSFNFLPKLSKDTNSSSPTSAGISSPSEVESSSKGAFLSLLFPSFSYFSLFSSSYYFFLS